MSATTVQTESGFHNVRAGDAATELKKAESISYKNLVDEVRATFKTGKTKDLKWRKQQLKQIQKCFAENHERITEAVRKDHGGPKFRGVFDMNAIADMNLFLKNIDRWAADEKVTHDSLFGKSYVRKEPKGVVLLIAPWNFPFAMVFDVLVPILGAGNCVIIKPSEVSENSCDLIAELIPKYFDNSAVKVVTGGVSETTALLREKFDHIMYTGNGAVGRIVMAAAAKNLTPVTLELGGKSPVYVDKSAKVKMAIARVSQFKWMNVGQICIAPDYVLVHEDVAEEFKTGIVQVLKKNFGATLEERKKNPDYARIINSRHVGRLDSALKNTRGKILIGGGNHPEDNFFDATIIEDPHVEDAILKEEIFGPLLPILTVKGVEEAAQKVNQICDKPLALYIFAQKQSVIDYFLDHTNSGGVAVNTTLEHISNPNLPFGGVGESGMGHYHGKWGFDEFTHIRSVYVKDSTFNTGPSIPQPPYGDTLYNLAVKMNITGFFTDGQRMALKVAGVGAAAAVGYALVSRSKL